MLVEVRLNRVVVGSCSRFFHVRGANIFLNLRGLKYNFLKRDQLESEKELIVKLKRVANQQEFQLKKETVDVNNLNLMSS